MRNNRIAALWSCMLAALIGVALAGPWHWEPSTPALAAETPKDIVATQVRAQGHPCKDPLSAQRDQAASKPDKPVWVLQCQDASYRVRLISGMEAQIQRLD